MSILTDTPVKAELEQMASNKKKRTDKPARKTLKFARSRKLKRGSVVCDTEDVEPPDAGSPATTSAAKRLDQLADVIPSSERAAHLPGGAELQGDATSHPHFEQNKKLHFMVDSAGRTPSLGLRRDPKSALNACLLDICSRPRSTFGRLSHQF